MAKKPHRVLAAVTALATVSMTTSAMLSISPASASGELRPFPQHVTYLTGVLPSASAATRDAAVKTAYNAWKGTYLKAKCGGYMVVAAEDAPGSGTVSEAQGYGMNIVPLMAGYDTNAKAEFDGMWTFVKAHLDAKGMMQWKINGSTCKYADTGTPDAATDGDLDVGYGLLLADAQWGGYRADALAWLGKFYAANVAADGHLKVEDDGPTNDTRPSDFMLDHLRAFAAYDTAHNWNKVVTRTEAIITAFTSAYSPTANLLSDFIVNADTTSPKPAPANYQENQPDNIVGYNSVRVPWHLGTDALVYGASVAKAASIKESNSYKNKAGGNPDKIYPHTKLDGTPYNTSDHSEAANAPVGVAAMAAGDQTWTDALWNFSQTNRYGDAYFGETIRMLVLIIMSGNYWAPTSATVPVGAISNGGFENGSTSGWTAAGVSSIVTAPVHGGSHAVQLGSTSPSTDSTVKQTFTAPIGASTLAVSYSMVCPDEVAYDWSSVTLLDNTTGSTTAMLGKTCSTNASYVTVTTAVTAGHSYTLTLLNHDENSPGDASYTRFDDALLS